MLNTQKADNRQFCSVAGLYRIWGAYAVGITILAVAANWIGLILFAVLVPLSKFAQIRYYRRLSPLFGYGKLAEDLPPQSTASAPRVVTFYSAMGCPFCPIVLERLEALQLKMGFKLERVNLSLHPRFAITKGLRSVPTIEVGDTRLIGNASSSQLAELIEQRGQASLVAN
jgi:glutaredoxin